MKNLGEIRKNRLKKLKNLIKAGINPNPAEILRTHTNKEALVAFRKLINKKIVLVGRIRSIREHGGSTFCHIEDGSTQVQVYFKKDKVGDKQYKLFLENIDIGDFIEVTGTLFKTKKGEKTLDVSKWRVISKSLSPLPSEWYGLEDIEERFRKRYFNTHCRKSPLGNPSRSVYCPLPYNRCGTDTWKNSRGCRHNRRGNSCRQKLILLFKDKTRMERTVRALRFSHELPLWPHPYF